MSITCEDETYVPFDITFTEVRLVRLFLATSASYMMQNRRFLSLQSWLEEYAVGPGADVIAVPLTPERWSSLAKVCEVGVRNQHSSAGQLQSLLYRLQDAELSMTVLEVVESGS